MERPKLDNEQHEETAKVVNPWRQRAAKFFSKLSPRNTDVIPEELYGTGTETVELVQEKFVPVYPMVTNREPYYLQPSYHENELTLDYKSTLSSSTYYTALSRLGGGSESFGLGRLRERDEYAQLLREQKLWPVDPMIEQNWSGRGQHVEFKKDEQWLINDILEVQGNLGNTRTAFVQSVRCRRILLARKTITCGKQTMTREEAITEVSHLTRLNHAHILRVIGSYVKGRELSILLYPVADYNLENFLDEFRDAPGDSDMWNNMVHSSERFYSCLSSAVQCIHRSLTKHMDIKPQNILIRKIDKRRYSPYVADFGIARSYETPKEIETDSRTSFTKRYAAPEVVRQDLRGLSADIFSLGCVFIEIFTTFISEKDHVEWKIDLQAVLDGNALGDTSYQANVKELQAYLSKCIGLSEHFLVVKARLSMFGRMLKVKPRDRPTAESLVTYFGERPCCKTGSVQLQAIANHIPESEG